MQCYKIYINCVLAFALIASSLNAKSANSYLKDLTKKYKNSESFQADFREIFEWAMTGEKVQREGNILITRDDKFRIDTPQQLIVCDGSAIYRLNRIKKQVIIEPVQESSEKQLPTRLMLQFADEFDAVEMFQMSVNDKPGVRLDLLPEKEDEALLQSATLWLTIEDMIVERLQFKDLNGNTTMYIFDNITFDQKIDPVEFKFSIPEDIEVFDLR